MISTRFAATGLICSLMLLASGGCSGRPKNVASVKGKVTLGGQPLAGATVVFTPTGEGSSSRGRTNTNGEYVMQYSAKVQGAQIGEHTVSISTAQSGGKAGGDSGEKVPFKYRIGADLPKATVNAGTNAIDFALEAGPIEPPQPKGKKKK